jgi:hypothetical protein
MRLGATSGHNLYGPDGHRVYLAGVSGQPGGPAGGTGHGGAVCHTGALA